MFMIEKTAMIFFFLWTDTTLLSWCIGRDVDIMLDVLVDV